MDLAAGPASEWSTGDSMAAMSGVVAAKGLAGMVRLRTLMHCFDEEMKGHGIACILLLLACGAGNSEKEFPASAGVDT